MGNPGSESQLRRTTTADQRHDNLKPGNPQDLHHLLRDPKLPNSYPKMRVLWFQRSPSQSAANERLLEMGKLSSTGKRYENVRTTELEDEVDPLEAFTVSTDIDYEEMHTMAEGQSKAKRSAGYMVRQRERERLRHFAETMRKDARFYIWARILIFGGLGVVTFVLVWVFGTKKQRERGIARGWEGR